MPDITMCDNQKCPLRNTCFRALAQPSAWQSWSVFEEHNGKCEYHIEHVPHTKKAELMREYQDAVENQVPDMPRNGKEHEMKDPQNKAKAPCENTGRKPPDLSLDLALDILSRDLALDILDYQFEHMPERRVESDWWANEAIKAMMDGAAQ